MDGFYSLLAARGEFQTNQQLALTFRDMVSLLACLVWRRKCEVWSSYMAAVGAVGHMLGFRRPLGLVELLNVFRDHPAEMHCHPVFTYFWALLLPAGTPLTPQARDSLRVMAEALAEDMHQLTVAAARQIIAEAVGANSFPALMAATTMPREPLFDIHGPSRRLWSVYALLPEHGELSRLQEKAGNPASTRALLSGLASRRCGLFAAGRMGRDGLHVDNQGHLFEDRVLRGHFRAYTPEEHQSFWDAGGRQGHLDKVLLGLETPESLGPWIDYASTFFNDYCTMPPLTVTIHMGGHDEALPACIPRVADIRQYPR